ncbi:hypothetical protein [Streptomyces sp. NPDC090036]|uniref:hypothetical protein n=1 Tax=Streptomyces sp. NPDC090036 TaxID=3365926 RepID=UPI0037FCFAE1
MTTPHVTPQSHQSHQSRLKAARALELLELGRGVLWSQKRDGRTDLKLLGAASPELAESLTRVRVLLEEARDPSAHTGRKRLLPTR